MARRIAIMDGGRIVEHGDAATVIASPASSTGRALVAATPELPVFPGLPAFKETVS
jgi:peptide/nickel transport system ATP-binding protein